MNELIIKEDGKYKKYEDLLLRRDQLNKESGSIHVSYVKTFGELILKSFELKVGCIKKRKMIAFCMTAVNHGKPVDVQEMNQKIEKEMALYYQQLKDMAADKAEAEKAAVSPDYKVEKAKRIYRRLAKLIHPDINPKAAESQTVRELWDRIVIAYRSNDDEELGNLEILVRKALKDIGEPDPGAAIDNLDERIEKLEEQINLILTTVPYIWGDILSSDMLIAERKEQIQAEIDEYKKLSEELSKVLRDILAGGGVPLTWIQD